MSHDAFALDDAEHAAVRYLFRNGPSQCHKIEVPASSIERGLVTTMLLDGGSWCWLTEAGVSAALANRLHTNHPKRVSPSNVLEIKRFVAPRGTGRAAQGSSDPNLPEAEDEVIVEALKAKIVSMKGRAALARELGITYNHVCAALRGDVRPGLRLAASVGYRPMRAAYGSLAKGD